MRYCTVLFGYSSVSVSCRGTQNEVFAEVSKYITPVFMGFQVVSLHLNKLIKAQRKKMSKAIEENLLQSLMFAVVY